MFLKIGFIAGVLMATAGNAFAVDLNVWATAVYSPSSGFIPGADIHKQLYDKFQAENPDIKLNYEIIDTGPKGLQRLLTGANANNLPDVSIVDGQWVARLLQANIVQSLDGFWPAEDQADFHPGVIAAETFGGKPYAIMFQTGMRGLIYRPSTLAAAGLKEFPKTWDDLLAAAEVLKKKGMTAVLLPARASEEPSTMHMLSVFWGLGGRLVDEGGAPVFFEAENGKYLERVYRMYHDMVANGVMLPDVSVMDEAALRPFFYGDEVFSIAQSSSVIKQIWSEQPNTVDDLAVAQYPMPDGKQPVTILGGYSYAMTTKDPERQAAAWKFIQFMTTPKNMAAVNEALGQLPVRNSIWKTNAFFSTNPVMVGFKQLYDGPMETRPSVPIYNVISTAISNQLAGVISGAITPAEAVQRARDQVMPEYERQQTR